jgi:hypothetical protein
MYFVRASDKEAVVCGVAIALSCVACPFTTPVSVRALKVTSDLVPPFNIESPLLASGARPSNVGAICIDLVCTGAVPAPFMVPSHEAHVGFFSNINRKKKKLGSRPPMSKKKEDA